jgi:hypothetical protein
MATSMFVNTRTTKLNEPNRFIFTYDKQTLFDFRLSDEEMHELETLVVQFSGRIFKNRNM